MDLPRPCCSSSMTEEQAKVEMEPEPEPEPQPSTSAAAARQLLESQENKLSGVEHEKEMIRLRAEMICAGCRCGWLCCDCIMGCMTCKQRRRFCYCRWVPGTVTGILVRVHCMICLDMLKNCTCQLAWRCKWCTVSIKKCKRGGCITLLPNRLSPEGAIYVEIFNSEDKIEDEEMDASLGRTMDKLSLAETSSSASEFSWDGNSSRRSSWSEGSSVSQQGEWWQNRDQGSSTTAAAADSSTETASVSSSASSSGDSRYDSSSTMSSMSSGGSYSSVGGKSDC